LANIEIAYIEIALTVMNKSNANINGHILRCLLNIKKCSRHSFRIMMCLQNYDYVPLEGYILFWSSAFLHLMVYMHMVNTILEGLAALEELAAPMLPERLVGLHGLHCLRQWKTPRTPSASVG
jgi:hypothetical protein